MKIFQHYSELRTYLQSVKGKIGFVPTMGALHDGHLSLVDIAKEHAQCIVVSIFVNPTQFSPEEDFDTYPRMIDKDIASLKAKGVDVLYLPNTETIYPDGMQQEIDVGPIGKVLEGKFRPHFFNGVAQVVYVLLKHVSPDIAIFGEKDYQQLVIIKQLVSQYHLPVEILGAPIIRETDGLAMSSRNIYLTKNERSKAALLYNILCDVRQKVKASETIEGSLRWAQKQLLAGVFSALDYIEIVDANTLEKIDDYRPESRLLVAVHLGKVRLIDNVMV